MKSAVEKLSPTRVKVTIDVPFNELDSYLSDAYKNISERVNIPGFRKGKVPSAMIDQRVGRGAVLDEAINAALPDLYAAAAKEHDVRVIGRPSVDITELKDREHLSFTVETDVRPEVNLPNFSDITLTVEDVVVGDAEIDEQIEGLRIRFGTLVTVEKAVETGDFISMDIVALVNGQPIDGGTLNDVSYEVGTNRMVDGLDEAVVGLSAGESKRFSAPLVGMAEGESGDVDVTVKAVKFRELPPLDDKFAELASEFETLAELRADVAVRLDRLKKLEQGSHARDLLVQKLDEMVEIPLPEKIIEDEVHSHLEKEGRLEDETHRAEVTADVQKSLKTEILLDAIIDAENVSVNDAEMMDYLIRSASRYQMTPDEFIKELSESGQIQTVVSEVARAKALAGILSRVKVVTTSGAVVDLEALRPVAPDANDDTDSDDDSEDSDA